MLLKKRERECRVCKKIAFGFVWFGLVLIRDFRLFVVWKTSARPTKLNWAVTQNMTEDCLLARRAPIRKLSSWNPSIFISRTGNCLYLCGLFSCPSEYILFGRSGDWEYFSSHFDSFFLRSEGPHETLEIATFILMTSVFGKRTKLWGVWRRYWPWLQSWGKGRQAKVLECLVLGKEKKKKDARC